MPLGNGLCKVSTAVKPLFWVGTQARAGVVDGLLVRELILRELARGISDAKSGAQHILVVQAIRHTYSRSKQIPVRVLVSIVGIVCGIYCSNIARIFQSCCAEDGVRCRPQEYGLVAMTLNKVTRVIPANTQA